MNIQVDDNIRILDNPDVEGYEARSLQRLDFELLGNRLGTVTDSVKHDEVTVKFDVTVIIKKSFLVKVD